ncbi:MAG: hypothetical protein DMG43_08140 [Acidobacteria bacterium]|nr:MAG: hypothetical protein DMG43_08140 [Acidobacteriota bacterium]
MRGKKIASEGVPNGFWEKRLQYEEFSTLRPAKLSGTHKPCFAKVRKGWSCCSLASLYDS